jgi:sporulation protein YlmC with PRC-barrel domain
MTQHKLAVAAAVAAALFGVTANAQAPSRDENHGAAHSDFDRSVGYSQYLGTNALRASELIGATVRNQAGTDLGEIEDLMVSRSGDDVVTAVLSVGGILGIGEKRIGVPYDELRVSEDGASFYLSATQEQLEARPTFEYPERREGAAESSSATSDARDHDTTTSTAQTRTADPTRQGEQRRAVEQSTAAQQSRPADQDHGRAADSPNVAHDSQHSAPVVTDTPPTSSRTTERRDIRTMESAASRASNIIGTTVTDSRGETLGEIDDLVVNPQGRIEAVLSVGGVLGVGARLIAVPMDDLMIERASGDEMQVRIDATADQLLDRHPEFRYEPQAANR